MQVWSRKIAPTRLNSHTHIEMSNRGALTVPTPIDQLVKQYQRPLIGVEIEETLRRIFALHMFT